MKIEIVNMTEKEYLIPDARWILWECDTFEKFSRRFLIKGKFSVEVPEDVIKSYEIVERLMAYSYYCYELYDEAFAKLTKIFEMAIKQRVKQLDIIYPPGKFISLEKMINDLAQKINPSLKSEWINAKEIRNLFAHFDRHNVAGPIGKFEVFHYYINILNRIFKDKSFIENIHEDFIKLNNKVKQFGEGFFILEGENNFLISNALLIRSIQKNGEEIALIGCTPLPKNFPRKMENFSFYKPITLQIKAIEISNIEMKGIDCKTGGITKIYTTDVPQNISAFKKFDEEFDSADIIVQTLFKEQIQKAFAQAIIRFEYEYFWD